MIPLLIFLGDSDDEEVDLHESHSNPSSMDPTSEPGPPSENPTNKPTLEPNYDALSEPSESMREVYMGHLASGDILR